MSFFLKLLAFVYLFNGLFFAVCINHTIRKLPPVQFVLWLFLWPLLVRNEINKEDGA